MIYCVAKTSVAVDELDKPMSTKELAATLKVSVGYVYKMRMVGFQMKKQRSATAEATPRQAMTWIQRTCFKTVAGKPTIQVS